MVRSDEARKNGRSTHGRASHASRSPDFHAALKVSCSSPATAALSRSKTQAREDRGPPSAAASLAALTATCEMPSLRCLEALTKRSIPIEMKADEIPGGGSTLVWDGETRWEDLDEKKLIGEGSYRRMSSMEMGYEVNQA